MGRAEKTPEFTSVDQFPVGAADRSEKLAMTGALVELPVR